MKRALNIAGLVAGLLLVLVCLPNSLPGALGLVAGLALVGVNIYALLVRRKATQRGTEPGGDDGA